MRKVSVGQWAMLIIGGLALLTTFLIGGGGQLLSWITPPAEAASNAHGDKNRSMGAQQDCTENHFGPSFGGAVVIDTNMVLCSTLTAFSGTVAINGTVNGNVVGFGSDVAVAGTVNGNIDLYGGSVVLLIGSHLHGDINLYAAHWTRGQGVQFVGAVNDHTQRELVVSRHGHVQFSIIAPDHLDSIRVISDHTATGACDDCSYNGGQ